MDESKVGFKQQLIAAIVSGIAFVFIYSLAGLYASGLETVPSFVFPFDKHIPFLPWMIVPYMSSGLLFVFIFFIVKEKEEFSLLYRRMLFITIVSGICFFLFPLRFSFPKPEVDSGFLNYFFQYLNTMDTNFNQAPSLHISYACLFWSVLSDKLTGYKRIIAGFWIFFMGASTLTIYQHHVIDVVTALMLVCVTFFIFPHHIRRNRRIAMVYFLSALLLILLCLYQFSFVLNCLLVWLIMPLARVGWAYLNTDAHFLKNNNGRLKPVSKIVCLPYILTYRLIRYFFCKNAGIGMTEIYPQVFIGAMPDNRTIKQGDIGQHIKVIDLTAELDEFKTFCTEATYYFCPMLDIASVKQEELEKTLDLITKIYLALKPGEKVYIHCLMGYSRCVFIGTMFVKQQLSINTQEAALYVKEKYPNAIYPDYVIKN